MKLKKKLTWITSVLTILFVMTGCTPNQQAVFDASMNMQNVRSVQQHTTMSIELNGSGFDAATQEQINTTAALLKNAKLEIDAKTTNNEQKTKAQSEANMNLTAQGLTLNMPFWVDMDLTGDTPKLKEIYGVPGIAQPYLPSQFAGKDYAVMDPFNMKDAELNAADLTNVLKFSLDFQTKGTEFLKNYAQKYNPNIDVVKTPAGDGTSAQKYTIKMNDKEFKEFTRYTVNNFAKDKDAMLLIEELLTTSVEMSKLSAPEGNLNEPDLDLEKLNENIPEFLDQFNRFMDQLETVKLLGNQGIELNYTINNGYIVNESGLINFNLDLSQMNTLMKLPEEQKETAPNNGTLNLTLRFNTDTTNINSPLDIKIPAVSSDNSFDYMDFMKVVSTPSRLSGKDRYETALMIAEEYNRQGESKNIILASGNNFPDALSATILSQKLEAPILLVGKTSGEADEALSFIDLNAKPDTKVYIIGGTGVIDDSITNEIQNSGYAVERLSGQDLYETNIAVVTKADIKQGTPVIIASGESFPDALSISSFAGAHQYPVLLTGKNELTEQTQNYITATKPSMVYITGGESVVSQTIEQKIKDLVPGATIKRLAGNNRFETTASIINEFAPNPEKIYLTSGLNFSDALAGSALAARTGSPILLIDPNSETLPPAIEAYLQKLNSNGVKPIVQTLGGDFAVPENLASQAKSVIFPLPGLKF
ncbi:cell wall-binding repeat-containing protein [Desulfitobacterium sp.]|uniref:cell wall-binding repeat-containing protein n=1 Tax=Desulfitobacterium sp. TaxID=49981 RepID=UPI002B1FBBA9|nr:cell wall-binding repeat-containing protein [Desulfitobacterium sp.]MEA4900334.1 cell wall-binding repeat-containing protein [Desulfitobacterium sp.]